MGEGEGGRGVEGVGGEQAMLRCWHCLRLRLRLGLGLGLGLRLGLGLGLVLGLF